MTDMTQARMPSQSRSRPPERQLLSLAEAQREPLTKSFSSTVPAHFPSAASRLTASAHSCETAEIAKRALNAMSSSTESQLRMEGLFAVSTPT